MKTERDSLDFASLLDSLGACLDIESAKRVIALKADKSIQTRVNRLAERQRNGKLTYQEELEYRKYVSYGTFVAILKSKARQILAASRKS